MKKTNVLLTGASGSVGFEALKQLTARIDEFNITVFDLKNARAEKLFEPYKNSIQIIYGDITNPADTMEACKNQDYVIHLAALIPPKADELLELARKINTEGTRHLVKNLETYSPNAFLAYSSSVSVYGDRVKNPLIYVTDPLNPSPGDFYATTKIASEEIIRNCNLDWTIFRLSAIMGANNHKISALMFHMPLDTPIEITTPEDTARAFVHAAHKKEELNKRIFNLGGGEKNRIIYRDLLAENFRIFGLGKFNLPEMSFAKQNFHCGYYADGDELEKIVHFRNDTIQTYLEKVSAGVPSIQRFATKLIAPIAKKIILRQSEPWQAYKAKDREKMMHYFGETIHTEQK